MRGFLAGGRGGHGFPPSLLNFGVNVFLYSVIERGEPWISGDEGLVDEGAGFWGQAWLLIRHCASLVSVAWRWICRMFFFFLGILRLREVG